MTSCMLMSFEVIVLGTESRPCVVRQFRASQLSLWLNLIPKIHRSNDPDLCQNASVAPPCEWIGRSTRRALNFTASPNSTATSGPKAQEMTSRPRTSVETTAIRRRERPPDHVTLAGPMAASRGPVITSQRHVLGHKTNDHRLFLCIVIATGCVLLLLNGLMLSCFYCRKARTLRGQWKAFFAEERNSVTVSGPRRVTGPPKTVTLPPSISGHSRHNVGLLPNCPKRSMSLPRPKDSESVDCALIR